MEKMEESQTTAGGNLAEGEEEENESRTIPVTLAMLICLGKLGGFKRCAELVKHSIFNTKIAYF